MFGFSYIYSHNSLTLLEMISAIVVGVVIGLIIMYFVGRSVKWKTIYSMIEKLASIS